MYNAQKYQIMSTFPKNHLVSGEGAKKTERKTNKFWFVCMLAGKSEMFSFSFCFYSNNAHFSCFWMVAWEKKQKKLVFMEYVCMYVCQAKTNIC